MKWHLAWLPVLVLSVPAAGCGSGENTSIFDAGTDVGATPEAGPHYDAIEVEPADATLEVMLGNAATTQDYKAFAMVGGQKTEVTSGCTFAVADSTFGSFSAATFAAAARGGTTKVSADCAGTTGSTGVTLHLTGFVVQGGAPGTSPALFKAAQVGADASRTPAVEYPIDKAVAPLNIPPVDAQWTTAKEDLFHLSYVSPHVAIDLYTAKTDAMFDEATWKVIAESTAGDDVTVAVEGLQQAAPSQKFVSAPVTLRMSHDTINNTAIYYWASSNGNLMTQTFGETGAPNVVHGDCTSCHSVSRSGSRIGYSRCVGNNCGELYAGFMRYDTTAKQWTDTLDANAKQVRGSYTTFAPVGNPFPDDKTSVALLAQSDCTLNLYDPDTGKPVASNVKTISTHAGGQAANRCATMPDWSPDGATIAFASTPNQGQWIDVSGSAIATMSYTYAGSAHTFGEPSLVVKGPLTLGSGSYTNFFFPSFAPEGDYIVFDAARGAWRNFQNARSAGQRLMLTNPTGSWTVDLANLNGPGDNDVTWPHWAPTSAADYYWVVFSSERDYGHLLTQANTASKCVANGVSQCKQIWIAAIDRAVAGQGKGANPPPDPSSPPMWMPGQDIGADNISPYWTLPTSSIPK